MTSATRPGAVARAGRAGSRRRRSRPRWPRRRRPGRRRARRGRWADASTALAPSLAVGSGVRAPAQPLEGARLPRRDPGGDRATGRGHTRTALRPWDRTGPHVRSGRASRRRAGPDQGSRRAPGLLPSHVVPPAEHLPGRRIRRHRPAVHPLQALGPVQHAAPMLRAVLPRQARASRDQPAADQLAAIPVDVHRARESLVAIDVEVEATMVPVRAAPERHPDRDADAEREEAAHDPSRRVVVVRRIGRIGPGAVDDQRIVGRHVDQAGLGRLDADDRGPLGRRGLDGDHLLRGGGERALGAGSGAEPLDRVHQLLPLRERRVAELLRPCELLVHHAEHRGERDQRLHAVVPALGGERLVQG